MKNIIIIICASFLSLTGRAQINLVNNPSFEQNDSCPDNYDEVKYAHWTGLDTLWNPPDWAHAVWGVPDYCHTCAPLISSVSIPQGTYYYHYPRTGNAMVEVEMFYDETYFGTTIEQYRDYLQSRLIKPLVAGKTYLVTFYVSSEAGSYYSVNNIGAYFDDGTIDTTHNPGFIQTHCTPQIIENTIINDTAAGDTTTWIKIQDTLTARGNERFITIGQFTDKAHTNFFAVQDTTGGGFFSLYLVDDVSVIDCGNIPNAGHDTLITLGDSVFIGSHELLIPYTWYQFGSSTPIDSGGGFWAHPTATTTYVVEQNLCGIKKWDTVKVWVAPVGVSTLQYVVNNLKLYPNPATTELIIEHAANCGVTFYDVAGRVIINAVITSDKQQVNIASLDRGIYLVEVIDRTTGVRVLRKVNKE